jgi:hypothetical protein
VRMVLYRRFRGDALFRFLHSDESWIEFRGNPAALTQSGFGKVFKIHAPPKK